MIPISNELKNKIIVILTMGTTFIENTKSEYKENADIKFLFNAFDMKFKFYINFFNKEKEFDLLIFKDDITAFENALFAWSETLIHIIPCDSNSKNGYYTVLYGVLQGVESLLEQDMIEYQDRNLPED